MTNITHTKKVSYSAQKMYALVNDVGAYPEFLPWCKASEVLTETDKLMIAILTIQKGFFEQSFTTKNILQAPSHITMNLKEGPFKHLTGTWSFDEIDDDNCEIKFELDFVFNSFKLAFFLEPLFKKIADTMIEAFIKRAEFIYD
jgi:ribosome-associated toxin RatA of RatAB toxin-antitoxin module